MAQQRLSLFGHVQWLPKETSAQKSLEFAVIESNND